MSATPRRVVIVGGGVVGTSCAYFLNRAGWKVTIIEQGAFGSGCSKNNCGYVCPSHVLPLAEPGMVGQAIRALFQRNAPFAIRPRLDPALWAWLIRFALRCNRRDMIEGGRGIQALLNSSRSLYDEIVEREALDCEWQPRGLLYVYRTSAPFEAYAEIDRLNRDLFQCPAHRVEAGELVTMEPALNEGLAGGWYYEHDAHLRPDRLLTSWRRQLEAAGVEVREQCAFEGFRTASGRAEAVVTPQDEITADAVVLATGAWTPRLNRHLGCRIPIQPGKGYSLTMPRPEICPTLPLIFPETRVAVTPFASGYRLGSMMEFAGYDTTIAPRRLQLLKDGARPYLREPYCDPIEDSWYGWRPMTFDGRPIIDRSPALENVMIAAGHNMLGMSMAPATGQLVAELLSETGPHLDPAPYRLGRFGRGG